MDIGSAIIIVGISGLLLAAAAVFRNYLAGILWAMAMGILTLHELIDIGLRSYWILLVATALTLSVGLVMRWSV